MAPKISRWSGRKKSGADDQVGDAVPAAVVEHQAAQQGLLGLIRTGRCREIGQGPGVASRPGSLPCGRRSGPGGRGRPGPSRPAGVVFRDHRNANRRIHVTVQMEFDLVLAERADRALGQPDFAASDGDTGSRAGLGNVGGPQGAEQLAFRARLGRQLQRQFRARWRPAAVAAWSSSASFFSSPHAALQRRRYWQPSQAWPCPGAEGNCGRSRNGPSPGHRCCPGFRPFPGG